MSFMTLYLVIMLNKSPEHLSEYIKFLLILWCMLMYFGFVTDNLKENLEPDFKQLLSIKDAVTHIVFVSRHCLVLHNVQNSKSTIEVE